MSTKKSVCYTLINNFKFRELFNVLGWNHTTRMEQLSVDGLEYHLEAIAEKSSFFVFHCKTSGRAPDYIIRKKIDSEITKQFDQHLIIYSDNNRRQQVWQLVVKELGKPAVVREATYFSTQEPESLFQKLQHIFFTIDEEENIAIVDVANRIDGAFNTNAEKVTKKFYEGFKTEYSAFLTFISGISEPKDRDCYASLMLNRLIFIYFIQQKGFLNGDKFYLKTRLDETRSRSNGQEKSCSFYRSFLLVLFHQGLGSPGNRKFEKELGKVPYLNGGLFEVHELETTYADIRIADKACERILNFFGHYEWCLDTRQQVTGKEINPDVIGRILEKHVYEHAGLGSNYTSEDITDYIGKNSIIPFLFDELGRRYPAALNTEGEIWSLLKNHADDYINDEVKHGALLLLPTEISAGLDDVSKRTEWEKTAPAEYALPTEIWPEVIERRRRYAEVKGKIEAGEIHEINDLISLNLNITRFTIDLIQNSTDHELVGHFYKALEKITVLDPTCSSGDFLFAALNILEPLYEACIGRMHAFVAEAIEGKYKVFEDILKRVNALEHPNLQYFIFKSIILNNFFGVDIMKEAIEIAKLRMFLKLVSTVDVNCMKPNMGLEPLPDIDFNIRSGNPLVGFVSIDEIKKAVEGQLGFYDNDIANIEMATEYVKRAYNSFHEVQIAGDAAVKEFKKILIEKLAELNERLDVYLGKLYGKNPKKVIEYKTWHDSHKPFHWFAEFYGIIHDRGGFDVIIGNSPNVKNKKVIDQYKILKSKTGQCADLYAFMLERSQLMLLKSGRFGMIIPTSITGINFGQNYWSLNFADRPAKSLSEFEKKTGCFFGEQ